MKSNPLRSPAFALLFFLCVQLVARAGDEGLSGMLRDALYAEEVSRDPEKAAQQYEAILARHDAQRPFAASALFRLAEVRRKQDRKQDAIALYQQLIREFPGAATEVRMARENLTALGAKPDEPVSAVPDKEQQELARLEELAKTSPDRLKDPELLSAAVDSGWLKVVGYLLDHGADPYRVHVFEEACSLGNLAICRMMVEKKGKVPLECQTAALDEAIQAKRWAVLGFLLDQGIHPDVGLEDDYVSALMTLAGGDYDGDVSKAAQLLLDHGANPNAVKKSRNGDNWLPTALHVALDKGNFKMAGFLLDHGAKPDAANDEVTRTPLHHAVLNATSAGGADMVKKLLDHGANPNATARRIPKGVVMSENLDFYQVTAFQLALDQGALEIAKLMIARGADLKQPGLLVRYFHENPFAGERSPVKSRLVQYPNVKYDGILGDDPKGRAERIRFLLEAGVDPNLPDERGFYPISLAMLEGNLESLELLLKHGASPDIPFGIMPDSWVEPKPPTGPNGDPYKRRNMPGLLNAAINPSMSVPLDSDVRATMVRMLLEAGARPGAHTMAVATIVGRTDKDGFLTRSLLKNVKAGEAREKMRIDRYTPAALEAYQDLVLYPALACAREIAVLNQKDFTARMIVREEGDGVVPGLACVLLGSPDAFLQTQMRGRSEECNWPEITLVRKSGDAWKRTEIDLPGDKPFPDLKWGDILEVSHPGKPTGSAKEDSAMRDLFRWYSVRSLSVPITCEQDGRTRKLLLRGDLLVLDPLSHEVPWQSPAKLAALFAREPVSGDLITVRRKGRPDVIMESSGQAARDFMLRGGDHLILPKSLMELSPFGSGSREAQLVLSGASVTRVLSLRDVGTPPATLVELLTFSCFPFGKGEIVEVPDKEGFSEAACAQLRRWIEDQHPLVVPSVPDLSNIRIHREGPDGKRTIIEVDLPKAIRACTDQTSPEDARRGDVALQVGDLVEIRVPEDRKPGAWQGFSPVEMRFFKKVLDGSFNVRSGDGLITEKTIDYQQPEWLETRHGWIPQPPARGVPSTANMWLVPESSDLAYPQLKRFIRSGSTVDMGLRSRLPRQRVVPPSSTPPVPTVRHPR